MAGRLDAAPVDASLAAIMVAASGALTPPASNRRRPLSSQAQRFAIMLQIEGGVVVAVNDQAATETFVDALAERHVLRFAASAALPGAGKIRRRPDELDPRSVAPVLDLVLQGAHGSPGDSPRQTPAAPVHHVADIQRLHHHHAGLGDDLVGCLVLHLFTPAPCQVACFLKLTLHTLMMAAPLNLPGQTPREAADLAPQGL